jgi:hypothetical protein
MRIRLPLKPLIDNWRHDASLIRYKMRRVPTAPGVHLHFSVHPQQPTVLTDSPLVLKMPKHQNSTVRHSGPSLSPYRKPSIQARTTDDAEVSEKLTALQQLARKLAAKRRIVIISGAGTSTNAGSKSQEVDVSCSNQIPSQFLALRASRGLRWPAETYSIFQRPLSWNLPTSCTRVSCGYSNQRPGMSLNLLSFSWNSWLNQAAFTDITLRTLIAARASSPH